MKFTSILMTLLLLGTISFPAHACIAPMTIVADHGTLGKNKMLGKYLHYTLDTEIDDDSVEEAMDAIDYAKAKKVDVFVLEINSPGGSVTAGFKLVKKMESADLPTVCVTDGMAASMASYILESSGCTIRAMTTRSLLMFHEPAVGAAFQGQPQNWENIAQMLKALSIAMANHLVARMNIPVETMLAKIDGGREWWTTWNESLNIGAIDVVVINVSDLLK